MINKLLKIIGTGMAFFLLNIIQNSFLVLYFNFNCIIILVILINILDNPENYFGIWCAFFAGLFLDLSSTYFFGFWMLILVIASYIIKWILNNFFKITHVSFFPKI